MNLIQAAKTMSSREIAALVESRHDNVKRTIDTLVEKGVIPSPQTEEKATQGRPSIEYRLDKRSSLIVVAQLCPEFTARVVDRWQELEQQAAAPAQVFSIPSTLPEALRLAAELEEQRAEAVAALAIAAPKAEALDRIATANGSLCLTDAAKELQVRPRDLIAWMSANKWIYKRAGSASWIAYQDRIQSGLLEHKSHIVVTADGSERIRDQVRVTPKGLTRIAGGMSLDVAA